MSSVPTVVITLSYPVQRGDGSMPKPELTQDQIMALYQHHEAGKTSAFHDPRGVALGYLSAYVIEERGQAGQLLVVTEISNANKYSASSEAGQVGGPVCYRRTPLESGEGWNDWVLVVGTRL